MKDARKNPANTINMTNSGRILPHKAVLHDGSPSCIV
jgi:hypothetical protein